MKTTEKRPFAHAMAFYHKDGLPSAWKQAMYFAGKGGRLATMPDIAVARLESKPGETPWGMYFTTSTAEYLGLSKGGKKILIVAHGIGPMSTLDGVIKAYSWQFKDKTRCREGGRITQQEFWDLEAGKFGEVSIIDFDSYCQRYEYPFIHTLHMSEALTDPVIMARFGSHAEDYVKSHAEHARKWHRKQADVDPENKYELPDHDGFLGRCRQQHLKDGAEHSDPYILSLGPSTYPHKELNDGLAIAHLLSVGGLCHLHHEGNESLTHDVSTHGWNDGTRVIGIKAGGSIKPGLDCGPDAHKLLREHWHDLLVPMESQETVSFRALVQIGDQWFTQYPKKGERMDSYEPEYVVISIEKIDEPVLFRTTVGGYHGFFKFGMNEVEAIAPPNANAYFFVGEPENEWNDGNPTHQTCSVQFFHVEIDASKRLVRSDQLGHDYETMMKLMAKKEVA